jgi:hypothetical protein
MDPESRRFFFLQQLKTELNLSSAEIAEVDRLLQKIQTGKQLQRNEIIELAEIKNRAEAARISMPSNTNKSDFVSE